MNVYLEDLHEAEANVRRQRLEFLRERGWTEQHLSYTKQTHWAKTFKISEHRMYDGSVEDRETAQASHLTTEEAIDLEITYGSKNLHRTN